VFYINVVKVDRDDIKIDRDVAYVIMVIHVCFKRMFQMFHLFQMYVTSVSSRCCKNISGCCICSMANWLYMYVANICSKCFICFTRKLQVFHLDVGKQILMLHMCAITMH
jgi:hypothetical protein